MTTIVTVLPHGHNAEVVITQGGVERVQACNPHGENRYAVYGDTTILVREFAGWAPKPTDATKEPA